MPLLGTIIKRVYEIRNLPIEQRRKKQIDPFKQQSKVLKKLLRKAQFTSFGEHFGFKNILEHSDFIQEFQRIIPIYDYNKMFREWWFRSLNGEPYVAWPGKVNYFALTSGTSESSSKYVPITGDMLRALRRASIRQLVGAVKYDLPNDFFEKGILMIGGSTHLHFNGTYHEGDLSGITAGNIPFWFQHFYKPGKRISKERDWTTKVDEIIRNAGHWDIGVIVGVPAWIQIILEKIIKEYKLNNIHDLWPNLGVYVHSGVAIGPYQKSFEKLFGKTVIFQESYLASEGYIAVQNRIDKKSMELILDNGLFYEFIPFNEKNFDQDGNLKENPEVVTIKDVVEEQEYALLLSSCAGAWRYLIGDVIKFSSKKYSEIAITGRTKHFLSICGEHLSLENITRAIEMLEDEFNAEVREFTVTGFRHHTMFAHRWYIGTDSDLNPQQVADKIDGYLKILNDDYRVERMDAIEEVFVEILSPEVFNQWMKIKGKEGGAHKFPRVLKKQMQEDWETFVLNHKMNHQIEEKD